MWNILKNDKYAITKAVLNPPFGKIEFTREEIMASHILNSHLTEILDKAFVERWVMHCDLLKEDLSECIYSLNANAEYLNSKISELRDSNAENTTSIVFALHEIRSACVNCARQIAEMEKKVEAGNAIAFGSGDRMRPADWLPTIIADFRYRVYGYIRGLIDLLPEDNDLHKRIKVVWKDGLSTLKDEQKIDVSAPWQPSP